LLKSGACNKFPLIGEIFVVKRAQAEKAARMMMRQYAYYKEDAPGCILEIPDPWK